MQNKPNPAGRDTPPFHYSIISPFHSEAYRAKRSQFPAGPGGMAPGRTRGVGAVAPNKANSRRAGLHQVLPGWGRPFMRNKPNSAHPPGRRGPERGKACKTNPIPGSAGGTRVAGQICETNPISGDASRDEATGAWDTGQTCETNPICPAPPSGPVARRPFDLAPAERNVQNEPNLRVGPWHGHPARGCESWAGCPCHCTAGWDGATQARDEGQLCKTNPISEESPMSSVKPESPSGCPPRGRLRKTKPIWATGTGRPRQTKPIPVVGSWCAQG